MKRSAERVLDLLLLSSPWLVAGAMYTRLPDAVPTHWNAHGQVDGTTPKPFGPFVLPMIGAVCYALVALAPHLSPRGFEVSPSARTLTTLRRAVAGFFAVLTVVVVLSGSGVPLPLDRLVVASIGLLFAVLGNALGKVTKNFFVGVRTPWTLADEEVWLHTNRLAGRLFVAGGVLLILAAWLGGSLVVTLPITVLITVVPIGYSFVAYRRSRKPSIHPPAG